MNHQVGTESNDPEFLEDLSSFTKTSTDDPGTLMKDLLEARREALSKKRTLAIVLPILAVSVLLTALMGFLIWAGWKERTVGDEFLYGTCSVYVGGQQVTGNRRFLRPYTEAFGLRFINPELKTEEILIDSEHKGLVIASLMKNDKSEVSVFTEEMEMGRSIPLGEKYLFVLGKDSIIVSHDDLCF